MAMRSGPKMPKVKSERKTNAKSKENRGSSMVSQDDNKPPESDGPIPAPRTLPGRAELGMERATIPPALNDDERRRHNQQMKDDSSEEDDYMIELNLMHNRGVEGAGDDFVAIFREIVPNKTATPVSKSYYSCHVSLDDLRRMVALDEKRAGKDRAKISIYKVWPDFTVRATLDRSIATVKADAAARSFAANGRDIVWAVIDSGVNQDHAHFASNQTLTHPSVAELHRDFTEVQGSKATVDGYGHGTHVAGIIAGGMTFSQTTPYVVYQRIYQTVPNNPEGHPFT